MKLTNKGTHEKQSNDRDFECKVCHEMQSDDQNLRLMLDQRCATKCKAMIGTKVGVESQVCHEMQSDERSQNGL